MSLIDRLREDELPFVAESGRITLPKSKLAPGLTVHDEVMVWRKDEDIVVWDRVCDHAGGKLISRGDGALCPLHGWKFDPATGRYDNGLAVKTPLEWREVGEDIEVRTSTRRPALPALGPPRRVTVRYLNHACLIVEAEGVRFATDPWLLGSAFCDGWWLARPSPEDAFDVLNSCDFIYISHNHPDHLHADTLARVRRDMPIVTANFATKSAERQLRDLGFTDIHAADFGKSYVLEAAGLSFAVLKSGDFRDDSGLYFTLGDFSAVFAVDANFLNFNALPRPVTLLASSFAGGASGFPLCFDTYSEDEKRRVVARNRAALRAIVETYLKLSAPTVYLPYAGYFTEDERRDAYIKARNIKNAPEDYREIATANGAEMVNPLERGRLEFVGSSLIDARADEAPRLAPDDRAEILRRSADRVEISDALLQDYFARSGFQAPMILNLATCDDAFTPQRIHQIDFAATPPRVVEIERLPVCDDLHRETGKQVSTVRVRAPALARTLTEGLPWEDLSIGFQARFDRAPNVYEADFWYRFTNVYTASRARRAAIDCGSSCRKLEAVLYG